MSACASIQPPAPRAPEPRLVALDAAECRTLLHDDASPESLREAVARSLHYLQELPADRILTALDRRVTVAEIAAMLGALDETISAGGDVAQHICGRLRLYRADLPAGLLVTGYYQPELRASRTRSARFRYPLYRTPNDLVDIDLSPFCPACTGRVVQGRVQDGKLVPYYSRREIEAGALADRGYEIAWLDDPVEAFFLHVQGSAWLRFDDGVHMQVSYSSSNGLRYTSLGRVLVDQGKIPRDLVSLQALKDYLRTHADEQSALMAANQRYIFFRTVVTGPIGSLGVPLTAGRSLAADATVYPPGAPAFLRIAPRERGLTTSDPPAFSRVTLVQDAGAAITGPSRVDVFWGTGDAAEAIAGDMRNPGELYLVLPE